MPPRPSSRTIRYLGWLTNSGGSARGGLAGAAATGLPPPPTWVAPRPGPRRATAWRQAEQRSRWRETLAAAFWASWPLAKAVSAWGVGWLTVSGMAGSRVSIGTRYLG